MKGRKKMATLSFTWIHNFKDSAGNACYNQTDIRLKNIAWDYRRWKWKKSDVSAESIENSSFQFMKCILLNTTSTVHGNTMFVYLDGIAYIRLCLILDTVILLRAEVGQIVGDGDWISTYDFGAKVMDEFGDTNFFLNAECDLFK
jgi:hypothetical protein